MHICPKDQRDLTRGRFGLIVRHKTAQKRSTLFSCSGTGCSSVIRRLQTKTVFVFTDDYERHFHTISRAISRKSRQWFDVKLTVLNVTNNLTLLFVFRLCGDVLEYFLSTPGICVFRNHLIVHSMDFISRLQTTFPINTQTEPSTHQN